MNAFRLLGDFLRLLAIIVLQLKIWQSGSCAGVSGKSQILFAIVYMTRYLDLTSYYNTAYLVTMKVIFIILSFTTLYLIYVKTNATYYREHDTFRIEFLIIPAAILALLVNHDFTVLEILWTFSIYLESVAILPQFFLIKSVGKAEGIVTLYLVLNGSHRGLYIMNWMYRYYYQGYYDIIAAGAGILQTVLYCIYFCIYGYLSLRRINSESSEKPYIIST